MIVASCSHRNYRITYVHDITISYAITGNDQPFTITIIHFYDCDKYTESIYVPRLIVFLGCDCDLENAICCVILYNIVSSKKCDLLRYNTIIRV